MVKARAWTEEDELYLKENWGIKSMPVLMKKLGRSKNGICSKAYELGLGRFIDNLNGVTIMDLSRALNISDSCIINFIKLYSLPYKEIKISPKVTVKYVQLDNWWKWLDKHRHKVNFTKFERYSLGVEPDWVEAQRAADHRDMWKKKKNTEWASHEVALLKRLLKEHKYTKEELAAQLHRTPDAVVTKIMLLGLLERPLPSKKVNRKWTEKEVSETVRLLAAGHAIEDVAAILNRSVEGVKAKLSRTFKVRHVVGQVPSENQKELAELLARLEDLNAQIKRKTRNYMRSGKSEEEINLLIAEEFVNEFNERYGAYQQKMLEVKGMLNLGEEYHIDFNTGEITKQEELLR